MMGHAYGMGVWMLVSGLISIGVLVAAIWLILNYFSHTRSGGEPAENELRRRYAAGEIDHDEYQQRLSTLRH